MINLQYTMESSSSRMFSIYNNNYLSGRRRCSYCSQHNHNIRSCQHTSISPLRQHIMFVVVMNTLQEQVEYLDTLPLMTLKMICIILGKPILTTRIQLIPAILYELQVMRQVIEILPMFRNREEEEPRENKITINTISLETTESEELKECPICFDSKTEDNMFITNCEHSFCISCTREHLNTSIKCPLCRAKIEELVSKQPITEQNMHLLGKKEITVNINI